MEKKELAEAIKAKVAELNTLAKEAKKNQLRIEINFMGSSAAQRENAFEVIITEVINY